jgi:16S rRNA (guanine527-N7)-methyltransferase
VFHVKHEGLRQATEALQVALSADQLDRLAAFEILLHERAGVLGMVAKGDLPRLRERHLLDCLRAATVVDPEDRRALDLGTGAGLPGLVVAIARPDLEVVLAETRRQRIAFLELAVTTLGLANVQLHGDRAEHLTGPADLCFARAFKDLGTSWAVAEPLLRRGGRLVYFAGAAFDPARDVPAGVPWVTHTTSSLARSGALVIMTRQ